MGNKNYSSWSLRPWMLMKHLGLAFAERVLPLDTPEFARDVEALSPTRRVPVLRHGELLVWDSLAICEYACELAGAAGPRERDCARRGALRMRRNASGFGRLRSQWPMNARATVADTPPNPDAAARNRPHRGTVGRMPDAFRRAGSVAVRRIQRGRRDVCAGRAAAAHLWRAAGRDRGAYMATVLADVHMQAWLAAAAAETLDHRLF